MYAILINNFLYTVCFPSFSQVGALYFRVPRRIQIFGVANEGTPEQLNYLYDEDETIGPDGSKAHSPNAVVSMLHHHLEKHTKKSISLGLHTDNCCGQNKNKTVMAYLAWRVLTGLSQEIQLDFMRVGHTRCFVNAGFGLLKQKYRKADVDTVDQLAAVVDDSAGMKKPQRFCWEWRAWDTYFKSHFRAVKNITNFQQFLLSSEKPGFVHLSQSDTLEERNFKSCQVILLYSVPPICRPSSSLLACLLIEPSIYMSRYALTATRKVEISPAQHLLASAQLLHHWRLNCSQHHKLIYKISPFYCFLPFLAYLILPISTPAYESTLNSHVYPSKQVHATY